MNSTLGGQQLVEPNVVASHGYRGCWVVELRGFEPLTPHCQCENACAAACHSVYGVSDNACLQPVFVLMCLGRACG